MWRLFIRTSLTIHYPVHCSALSNFLPFKVQVVYFTFNTQINIKIFMTIMPTMNIIQQGRFIMNAYRWLAKLSIIYNEMLVIRKSEIYFINRKSVYSVMCLDNEVSEN